ncbi:hypothetical protein KGM48_02655 [Patescibacteria group bacterium]|nr:hypothetical protein [Patescibacteria group bacterium]
MPVSFDPATYAPRTRRRSSLRVGLFLASRLTRANIGTSLLIVLVMVLTYLNLIMVSGIMVGIVEGLNQERQTNYSGDIMVSKLSQYDSIQNSPDIESYLRSLPAVASLSPRYVAAGVLEANYADKLRPQDLPDSITANIVGIDPPLEDATTHFSHLIVAGQYLQPSDYDQVLVGTSLLAEFKQLTAIPGENPLPNTGVGSKIRVRIGNIEREMTIKGIVGSKMEEINLRAFIVAPELRSILGRVDNGVNEIAVTLAPGTNVIPIENQLKQSIVGANALVQNAAESRPVFFQDFSVTFNQLGSLLGGIGLIVACIVMFIIVFINIVNRRRSIGILQAIGIRSLGIELAYIAQAVLYTLAGSMLGVILVFGFLQPYFLNHPLDFPFSNGVLSVTLAGAAARIVILAAAIMIASYVPARLIMRQEIVDAILGR